MSKRIIGEHFTRQGTPKVVYDSRSEAKQAAERYSQQAYKCGFCKKFHTGGYEPVTKKRYYPPEKVR